MYFVLKSVVFHWQDLILLAVSQCNLLYLTNLKLLSSMGKSTHKSTFHILQKAFNKSNG